MNTKEISILLIENTFKDIENFLEIFKDENISILAAVNLKKAKSILKYMVPDLIVSELELEDGNAYEILNYVRNHEDYSGAAFLFLSKESDIKQKIKALSSGAENYLTKPYSKEELKVHVQRIIKRISIRRFDLDKKIFSSTENLNVVEMLQLLEKTQKSGYFTIFAGHKAGIFNFKNGNIVSGRFGPLKNRDAIYKIIEIENAIYEFEFSEEDFEVEIQESTQSLILDALKLMDESAKSKGTPLEFARSNKHEVFCVGFKKSQIMHLFDEKSYNVIAYNNSKDALNMLKKLIPDIIIIRPELEGGKGIEIFKILEKSPLTYHLPVIFLTSEKDEAAKINALKEGVSDYILPPITKYEFEMKIQRVIKETQLKKKEYSSVLRGSLINFTVLELIQGIQGVEKTCMITFYNGNDECTLFFSKGQLVNAKIMHHEGEEAVYKILMWCRGYFEIKFKDYPVPKAVKTSTFNLVLDGISRSYQEDEEEVDKIIAVTSKQPAVVEDDGKVHLGLYNFILETAKLDIGSEFSLSTVKTSGIGKFLRPGASGDILFVDLNIVDNDALTELASSKKELAERLQEGLTIVCFTSRPEVYNVSGVSNKYSWFVDYDDSKQIIESLSDQIVIKTTVDFFEFNEVKDMMYYTAAFPTGFGTPAYSTILFSEDDIPVAFYKKVSKGFIFLLPQTQSKEDFMNFFVKTIIPRIRKGTPEE
ncbi:response regulator [Thermodesulfobacteriota bacterium]